MPVGRRRPFCGTSSKWRIIAFVLWLVAIAAEVYLIFGGLLSGEAVKFFVQNQLGAVMALLAFLPLIVVIFLDKDMSKGQKAVAGGVGIVLALVATLLAIEGALHVFVAADLTSRRPCPDS